MSTTNTTRDLPELPSNIANVVRRIRLCESEIPAQLVMGHAMREYALRALSEAAPADKLGKAVRKFHAAKGRYHTQLACCELFDVLGLPNVKPGQEAAPAEVAESLKSAWDKGLEAGNTWRIEVDAYYGDGNSGNPPEPPKNPYTTAPTPPLAGVQATAKAAFEIVQGWQSATFGWQDNEPNGYEKARAAHDAECIRRIAVVLAASQAAPAVPQLLQDDSRELGKALKSLAAIASKKDAA